MHGSFRRRDAVSGCKEKPAACCRAGLSSAKWVTFSWRLISPSSLGASRSLDTIAHFPLLLQGSLLNFEPEARLWKRLEGTSSIPSTWQASRGGATLPALSPEAEPLARSAAPLCPGELKRLLAISVGSLLPPWLLAFCPSPCDSF